MGENDATTELLLGRLAAVERELAMRRAASARSVGAEARAWWHEPRECVAMLCRHDGAAALVTDAIARAPRGRWAEVMPALEGCETTSLRAARRGWLAQLAALARGEPVVVEEAPRDRGYVAPAPAPVEAPARVDGGAPAPRRRRVIDPAAAGARLDRWLARAFAETDDATVDDEDADNAPSIASRAWLEVVDDADGRAQVALVAPPVVGLAPFVKRLVARCGAWSCAVRRENLVARGVRVAVPPAATALTWSTGDDEDDRDFAAVLSSMTPEPLASDRPTVFRRDIEGVSQRITGVTLARGARYAVVTPPAFAAPVDGAPLGDGWWLWSLEVPALVPDALAQRLDALGLALGDVALSAEWVVTVPARWERTPRGVAYPVFAQGAPWIVRVSSGVARDDVTVFVHGADGTLARPLATTAAAEVSVDALGPGRYALEVTAADLTALPARLLFAIEPAPTLGRWPQALPEVRVGDVALSPGASHTADLSALGEALPIACAAPPAMSAYARWESATRWRSDALAADRESVVALDAVLARTAPLRASSPEGVLTLDFGEWGSVTLHHRRTLDDALASSRGALREALDDRQTMLAAPTPVTAMWASRVAAALGFSARALPDALPAVALDDVALDEGFARPTLRAVLAVVPEGTRLRDRAEGLPRRAIDLLCARVGARRAFVTDGARWWDLDPARGGAPPADDLAQALDDDDALAGFLARYGAWR